MLATGTVLAGYGSKVGCAVNRGSESILVGGNQGAAFAFDESADMLLFDNTDRECAGEPVGGPFEVSGSVGSRTAVVLHGSPGELAALTLEL